MVKHDKLLLYTQPIALMFAAISIVLVHMYTHRTSQVSSTGFNNNGVLIRELVANQRVLMAQIKVLQVVAGMRAPCERPTSLTPALTGPPSVLPSAQKQAGAAPQIQPRDSTASSDSAPRSSFMTGVKKNAALDAALDTSRRKQPATVVPSAATVAAEGFEDVGHGMICGGTQLTYWDERNDDTMKLGGIHCPHEPNCGKIAEVSVKARALRDRSLLDQQCAALCAGSTECVGYSVASEAYWLQGNPLGSKYVCSTHSTACFGTASTNYHSFKKINAVNRIVHVPSSQGAHAPRVAPHRGGDGVWSKDVRVAVCIAGAWREWDLSWPSLQKNVVGPLNADVYVVTDTGVAGGVNARANADTTVTLAKIRHTIGSSFKGGKVNTPEDLYAERIKRTTPVVADGRNLSAFPYMLKIWQCGQLIHRSNRTYDVVVRTRPDMFFARPYRISRFVPRHTRTIGTNSFGAKSFRLQAGSTDLVFGERSVVIPSFTYLCGNDQLHIGSYAAMTVTMDLARFVGPRSSYFSWSSNARDFLNLAGGGLEAFYDQLWRRTGTTVHRVPLSSDMTRNKCYDIPCMRADDASHKIWPEYGAHMGWNDCANGNGDFYEYAPFINPVDYPNYIADYAGPRVGTAHTGLGKDGRDLFISKDGRDLWHAVPAGAARWYANCTDVEDLGIPWPLKPCTWGRDGKDAQLTTHMHRVKVIKGYGVPFFPDVNMLDKLRKDLDDGVDQRIDRAEKIP